MTFLRSTTLLLLISCAGCDEDVPPPDQSYTTRGRITHVSHPGADAPTVSVHHEAIPTFVDRDGEVVGMNSMVMSFAVAQGVALDAMTAGDLVELDFDVRWSGADMLTVTRMTKLSDDADLELTGGPRGH